MTYALEEAVELLGVDAVGSLHFAVEPMRARPDADVADAFVDQVPVERGAEPLAVSTWSTWNGSLDNTWSMKAMAVICSLRG
jgi:hypothetical protein